MVTAEAARESGQSAKGARAELHQLARADGLSFALRFDESSEYVDVVEGLIRVPRSPRWLTGLFLNDGVAVPLIDLTAWARSDGGGAGAGATKGRRRALRFGAGLEAWAIQLTQVPSVVERSAVTPLAVPGQWPLSVVASCGRLLEHTESIWQLPDQTHALRVNWPLLNKALRADLSSISMATESTR